MSSHLHNRVSVLAWVCYSIVQSVLLPFSLSTSGVDSHSRLRVCVLVVYFISHSQELSLVRLELLIYGPAGGACHNFLTLKSPVPPPHKLLHTGWRPALTSPPCSYVRTCSAAVCLQRSQFVRMFPQEYHECLSCPHALAIARAICASVFVSQLCVCVCVGKEKKPTSEDDPLHHHSLRDNSLGVMFFILHLWGYVNLHHTLLRIKNTHYSIVTMWCTETHNS